MAIKLASPSLGSEEIRAASEIIKSGWVVHGPKNREFEELIAAFLGVRHCVAVNSGASALHLALLSCGITSGEVIIPSYTMSATANAVVTAGCTPVFADIDPLTGNIDPNDVEKRITKKTRAIMPVHFAGQSCDMTALTRLAKSFKLHLIEDAAETLGGKWQGRPAGTFGKAGCLSFWASKAITTGEGGALVTNDATVAKTARALSAHGIASTTLQRNKSSTPWKRNAILAGYNFRLSHIAAAIGVEQAKKLPSLNTARRRHARQMIQELQNIPGLTTPFEHPKAEHVYQMFVITVPQKLRDRLVISLRSRQIEASVHFDPPVHQQSFYRKNFRTRRLPHTERLARTAVTLPLFPGMTSKDVSLVTHTVREVLKGLS